MQTRVGFGNQDSWKIKLQWAIRLHLITYAILATATSYITFTLWYNCFYINDCIPCYYPNCIILVYYIG